MFVLLKMINHLSIVVKRISMELADKYQGQVKQVFTFDYVLRFLINEE